MSQRPSPLNRLGRALGELVRVLDVLVTVDRRCGFVSRRLDRLIDEVILEFDRVIRFTGARPRVFVVNHDFHLNPGSWSSAAVAQP